MVRPGGRVVPAAGPHDDELYRFQVEAAHELGLPKPEAPALASEIGASRPRCDRGSIHRMVRRRSAEDRAQTRGSVTESARSRPDR